MELIDKFIKFEYTERLFEKKIQGVKIWHYIRGSIYGKIVKQKYDIGQAHSNLSGKKIITRVWYKLKQIPNFILKNPLYGLDQRDILVLNHQRRVKNGNYYNCIYTDEILKNINKSYYVFEFPYNERHFKPARTRNLKYLDYVKLIRDFKIFYYTNLIKPKIAKYFSKNERKYLKSLVKKINEYFELNITNEEFYRSIIYIILKYRFSKKYYEIILNKVNPKILIEVNSYCFNCLLFNELAKKRGIKIIELQHGVIGKYHIAYNFYRKINLDTFPDYIFLFGDFWKKNVNFPITKKQLIVAGFPYMENQLNNYKNHNNRIDNVQNILFISQGTIGKKLSKLAIDLNEIINHKKYKIIYKLHPGEYDRWKREYPWLLNKSIDIIDNNTKDIYYFFQRSKYQVGVCSTALFEGLHFDLTTIIYKVNGHENMEELYKKGYAILVSSAKEIKNNLENYKKVIIDKEFLWKSNSTINIISNINRLVDN